MLCGQSTTNCVQKKQEEDTKILYIYIYNKSTLWTTAPWCSDVSGVQEPGCLLLLLKPSGGAPLLAVGLCQLPGGGVLRRWEH